MKRDVSFIAALDFEDRSAGEVLESLQDAGYDSVEWTMAHVEDLRQPASALACQMDLVTGGETAVAETLRAIEAAAEAGIGIVNVLTGPNLWEDGARFRDDEEAWSIALGALERITDSGESAGVKIGFEPWGRLEAAGIAPNGEHAMEEIEEACAAVYRELAAAGALAAPPGETNRAA